MRISTAAAILALALTVSACGGSDDDESGSRSEMIGDKGLDVCGLVSDTTVASLQEATDTESEPVEDLWEGAESFIQCTVVSDVKVSFAVRALADDMPVESMVEGAYGSPAEPLEGIGDTAVIGTNTYDGIRIAATSGDQEVVVDSEFRDGGDAITRDDVVALAKEVMGNLGDEKPAAISLPKACPQPDDDKVKEMVGTVAAARGAVADNGSVGCRYAGAERRMSLGSSVGDSGFNLMLQADSEPENHIEVDGDPALFDDEQLVVFSGDDCALVASVGPFGDGPADQRTEEEIRDEAIDLVKYVKEEIGCPS